MHKKSCLFIFIHLFSYKFMYYVIAYQSILFHIHSYRIATRYRTLLHALPHTATRTSVHWRTDTHCHTAAHCRTAEQPHTAARTARTLQRTSLPHTAARTAAHCRTAAHYRTAGQPQNPYKFRWIHIYSHKFTYIQLNSNELFRFIWIHLNSSKFI
jgi:hypothetical protein